MVGIPKDEMLESESNGRRSRFNFLRWPMGRNRDDGNGNGNSFDRLIYEDIDTYSVGYPQWAALQNSDPTFRLYKRFGTLRNTVILHGQQELALLEEELTQLLKADLKFEKHSSLMSEEVEQATSSKRRKLIDQIDTKLAQYDDLLERERKSALMQKPSTRNYRSLVNYIWNEKPIAEAETPFLKHRDNSLRLGTSPESPLEKVLDWLSLSKAAPWRNRTALKSGTRRSGLKMLVNGMLLDAFADTGSMQNIVDEAYALKHGLQIKEHNMRMQLGDRSTLFSSGTVEFEVAFADDPANPVRVIARVVRNFSFDLLLGNTFLKTTKTLTKFIHRFTNCAFPRLTSNHSFNSIGHISERFHVALSNNIAVGALLDTGANCNVVDFRWAKQKGLYIYTDEFSRGWIRLPSGKRKPTLGQVHTTIALLDGRIVSITLEVLEGCINPVVLGDEVIFNYNLYDEEYADAFTSSELYDANDELLYMDYEPWYVRIVQKAKEKYRNHDTLQTASTAGVNDTDELERQWAWDLENGYGAEADKDEWMDEYSRREKHEKAMYPGVTFQDKSLIRHMSPELVRDVGELPYVSHAASAT